MKKTILIFTILLSSMAWSQITGLSGWNIVLDPGHSQQENMGIYNYPEAMKNLYVAKHLRAFLLDSTDIDTVYMTRTDSLQIVGLSQRSDYANSIGAAWFHSIHSDAGAASSNTTLLLWGQYANGLEKVPNGGKAMSDIMIGNLTKGMRTGTSRGSIGDCSFYGCTSGGPYLSVNRLTNMPSELSEAGFHTNPMQNTLNMNYEWKRLEAKTFWWSIIKFKGANRPYPGIMAGKILDQESGLPINGATVTVDGRTYKTDSYQSLFYKYTTDSTLLRNGFYYFERVPGGNQQITVSAPGYETYVGTVAMSDTFFTFKDVQLGNTTPPYIAENIPAQGDSIYPGLKNIQITFSRPMDVASVNAAISFNPPVAGTTNTWSNSDRTISITTTGMAYNTQYTMTIQPTAMDKFNHPLDGDGNGTGGDPYVLTFKTRVLDQIPPVILNHYPAASTEVKELRPVINISFNEPLKTSSLGGKISFVNTATNANVQTYTRYYPGSDVSAINIFTREDLVANQQYKLRIEAGVEDMSGNPTTQAYEFLFTRGNYATPTYTTIDAFESGIANWWVPQQSGTTTGILTDTTNIYSDGVIINHGSSSAKSMKLTYGWDVTANEWLIREYFGATSPTFGVNDYYLETYIFGDGSGNKFRFCVNDAGTGGHEVGKWITVDWFGWKLVQWDLQRDTIGSWIGNGQLEAPLGFDSYQITRTPGGKILGTLYFDDLQYARYIPVGIEPESSGLPAEYGLAQNYPNPFNPGTVIKFSLPSKSTVTLDVYSVLGEKVASLINSEMDGGTYNYRFDATDLPGGVYIYRLSTGFGVISRKMLLLK
ncbi:MAG: Ig-like domain-containing protein [Bacteroidetes bacterium]|nr:Ig-like domain-containing protein [Bacteroidota bacterium]